MIIDSHAHLYPSTGSFEDWDFADREEETKFHQRTQYTFGIYRPHYRSDTNAVDPDAWRLLWDESRASEWDGMRDVGFRVEGNDFVFEKDGIRYTSAGRTEDDPGKLLGLMDACGVDAAVLHATMRYSRYNARIAKKYPGRFIPLANIEEMDYSEPSGIEKLHWAVEELGAKGIHHNPYPAWECFKNFESDKYKPFWREMAKLGIPVWCISSSDVPDYPDILTKIRKWVYDVPELTRVMVHGFPPEVYIDFGKRDKVIVPQIVKDIVSQENFHMEFLPYAMGFYTHPKSDDMVRALYEEFGGAKFTWGSEFIKAGPPHTKENYKMMMGYFDNVCGYMSKSDVKLILGDNLKRIFKIP